ncbi:MAG: helix-turn-helix transcriptional regulator [Deltaproteobacteria bacterium]|nr:helix-turn-helix transcriptional regulator [Deltaproteobacteria bacterium]MBM4322323.1 helix-turn-helix transcriptional regulator [Deltaproteobacteria bacterium]
MSRLREIRRNVGLTQFRLMVLTGINAAKISLHENGLVNFSEDEKRKLAVALGVSIEELFPDREMRLVAARRDDPGFRKI